MYHINKKIADHLQNTGKTAALIIEPSENGFRAALHDVEQEGRRQIIGLCLHQDYDWSVSLEIESDTVGSAVAALDEIVSMDYPEEN